MYNVKNIYICIFLYIYFCLAFATGKQLNIGCVLCLQIQC